MQHCHADTGYGEKNHASLMSNSPYCLLYNSYDVTSESGKILSWSHMGVKGLKSKTEKTQKNPRNTKIRTFIG